MIERVKTKPGVIIDIKDGNLNKPAEQPEKIKSYLQTQNSLNNSSDKSIKTCPHNSEQSSEKKISDADEDDEDFSYLTDEASTLSRSLSNLDLGAQMISVLSNNFEKFTQKNEAYSKAYFESKFQIR